MDVNERASGSADRRRLLAVAVGICALVVPFGVAQTAAAAPTASRLVVDDDGVQCGFESYSTIGAALAVAVDGTTIEVCPGLYQERLHVTKSVKIVGPVDAVSGLDCFAVDPAKVEEFGDTTRLAVLEPPPPATTEATEPLVTLDADGVDLGGLVIRGVIDDTAALDSSNTFPLYIPAVLSTEAHSGYRIHDNVVRQNTLGVELGGSGASRTRLDHNCLRENEWAVANQRMHLEDALIDANTTFRTTVTGMEIGWAYRGTEAVMVQENTARESGYAGIIIENSTDARVASNYVMSAAVRGIWVSAGNSGVEVIDNVVQGGGPLSSGPVGILFTRTTLITRAALPQSTGIDVRGNTVSGIRPAPASTASGFGIAAALGALFTATITDNVMFDNGQAGLFLANNNVDNELRDNLSYDNGAWGIRVLGVLSTGNDFRDNIMYGNGAFDASDTSGLTPGGTLLNTWIDNDCVTDEPTGLICGVE